MASSHIQKVRLLYKTILRLHRGLPPGLRLFGDEYARAEFKAHRVADPAFVEPFMVEWAKYALDLSRQLGIEGVHGSKPLGKDLNEKALDLFSEEQLSQLYELYKEASNLNQTDDTDDKNSTQQITNKLDTKG